MRPYFEKTRQDSEFYREHLQGRMPERIFDVHVHINLPEHISTVPPERWLSDWALESGHLLPCEDAYSCVRELYPETDYRIAGFPWPIREADLKANNSYLAEMRRQGRLRPFMCVRPEWPADEVERTLLEGSFSGFKPYADMVSGVKGADISIFDFMPHEHWRLLDRHKKAVMLHLPRKGRFADNDNIRELKEIRDKYAEVKIIIAHFGRSFCPVFLEEGLDKLGGADGFYFDTAAVMNPAVYDVAFDRIPAEKILYGSDMPILFWHGRREWTEREYRNLCREDFSWNRLSHRSPEEEDKYTLFLYEQMRSILHAMDRRGLVEKDKDGIFFYNAERLLQ